MHDEIDGCLIRSLTDADLDEAVALNKKSYPTMAEDNVVWTREQLESHLRVFPDGQLVAEKDGRLIGAVSTLIVSLGPDPYRDHTWAGITDNSWFTNHDPTGDTLYGADIYVDPDARGQGVGRALYEARRRLCRRLNLRRIVLGGRLYNYGRHAKKMSPIEYARRVEEAELHDTVLSFQLREGFVLRKVMPHYLRDRRSRNFATFLEWINPEWKPEGKRERSIRVTCVQYQMRKIDDFEGFARQVEYFVDVAADYRSQFILFPELLTAQLMSYIDVKTSIEAIRRLTEYTERIDQLFGELAAHYRVGIISGSHPTRISEEEIHNVASLYLPDGRVFRQPKLHITPNERRWWGIEGGGTLQVFETPWAKVGILICYDVEFPEAARYLADQGAEVIFVPFCTDDRQAYLRVRYCAQARCIENVLYVAMAGTVGNLPETSNMDVQYAQSAVLSPSDFPFARDGVVAEATPNTEMVVTCDLRLDVRAQAVMKGSVTPRLDRRPDLFRLLAPGLDGEPAVPSGRGRRARGRKKARTE